MANKPIAAIAGLGFSRISREAIGSARQLAQEAMHAAAFDAGVAFNDIDGFILIRSPSAPREVLPLTLQRELGMPPLRLLCSLDVEGASSLAAVQHAALALQAGMASAVMCVFADARIESGHTAAGFAKAMPLTGIDGWEERHGLFGAVGAYAMSARRFMFESGASEQDLGAYAIACREWAALNPQAMVRTPLTMADYLASRWICEPLRLLDCAFPVNGAIAVLLVRSNAAKGLPQPPVYVLGMGQCHVAETGRRTREGEIEPAHGGGVAATDACRMAGVALGDMGSAQFYDPFASVGLQMLEGYGFCARGQAGAFVRDGHTRPGGRLPVNTGGGHLSGHYLQGMTPLAEAVAQARGTAGPRQVQGKQPLFVGGMGGRMNYHAALVVSGEASFT
jgi:acetyl-CoA acetyltransferase